MKFLRSWWTRQGQTIIAPSEYLSCWIRKWGISKTKIKVIYNAIESIPDKIENVLPPSSLTTVISIGRMISWKGFDKLAEVAAEMPDIRLVIVGGGPDEKKIRELIKKYRIENRVSSSPWSAFWIRWIAMNLTIIGFLHRFGYPPMLLWQWMERECFCRQSTLLFY